MIIVHILNNSFVLKVLAFISFSAIYYLILQQIHLILQELLPF